VQGDYIHIALNQYHAFRANAFRKIYSEKVFALFINRRIRRVHIFSALFILPRHCPAAEGDNVAAYVYYGEHYALSETVVNTSAFAFAYNVCGEHIALCITLFL